MSRTVVYAVVTAVLAGLYIASIVLLQLPLRPVSGTVGAFGQRLRDQLVLEGLYDELSLAVRVALQPQVAVWVPREEPARETA